jgi:hypothetical protein
MRDVTLLMTTSIDGFGFAYLSSADREPLSHAR